MNGNSLVIDSNIIIYLSKELLNIEDILKDYDDYFISIITYMEVLGYNFDNEEDKNLIEDFLSLLTIVDVDLEIAQRVINIRKIKKIKLPDAIILATVQFTESDLITKNIDDFVGLDEEKKTKYHGYFTPKKYHACPVKSFFIS